MGRMKDEYVEWMENNTELYEEFVLEHYEDEFAEYSWNKFDSEQQDKADALYDCMRDSESLELEK